MNVQANCSTLLQAAFLRLRNKSKCNISSLSTLLKEIWERKDSHLEMGEKNPHKNKEE